MNGYIVIPNYIWEDFANAIIIRAAFDYRRYRDELHRKPDSRLAKIEIESIERFFRSAWYEVLTTVDGQYILNRLQNEQPGYYPTKSKTGAERTVK